MKAWFLADGEPLRGDWLIRALTSSIHYFIVRFISEWAIRMWGLFGGKRSLRVHLWRVYIVPDPLFFPLCFLVP
jgi:hypothetical protein